MVKPEDLSTEALRQKIRVAENSGYSGGFSLKDLMDEDRRRSNSGLEHTEELVLSASTKAVGKPESEFDARVRWAKETLSQGSLQDLLGEQTVAARTGDPDAPKKR